MLLLWGGTLLLVTLFGHNAVVTQTVHGFADNTTNPCRQDPCENGCTCIPRANGDYKCDNSSNGFLGKNCSKAPKNVSCSDKEIKIEIPEWFVREMTSFHQKEQNIENITLYITSLDLRPKEHCVAIREQTPSGKFTYKMEISFPFNECGTKSRISRKRTFSNTTATSVIEFQNQVWWEQVLKDGVTMPLQLMDVHCSYDDEAHLNSAKNPTCCDPETVVTSLGSITIEMNYWKSLPSSGVWNRPLMPPFVYELNKKIYVTIRRRDDVSELEMVATNCYITPEFRKVSDNSSHIIKHGCPSLEFKCDIISNTKGPEILFSFEIFANLKVDAFYLHCSVQLCQTGCPKQCPSARTRKSTNSTLTANGLVKANTTVTIGPVYIKHDDSMVKSLVKKQPFSTTVRGVLSKPIEDETSWIMPFLLAFTNFTCVLLLGVLCYALARSVESRRRDRFQALGLKSGKQNMLQMKRVGLTKASENIAFCNRRNCFFKSKAKKTSVPNLIDIFATSPTPFNSPLQSSFVASKNKRHMRKIYNNYEMSTV